MELQVFGRGLREGWVWGGGGVTAACALPDFGLNQSLLGTKIWQVQP